MLDLFGTETVRAVRDLAIAGVAYMSFKISRDAASKGGGDMVLVKALAFCVGLGLVGGIMRGQSGCDDGDPMFGYCDAQTAAMPYGLTDRLAIAFYWFLLLFVPAAIGVLGRKGRLLDRIKRAGPSD